MGCGRAGAATIGAPGATAVSEFAGRVGSVVDRGVAVGSTSAAVAAAGATACWFDGVAGSVVAAATVLSWLTGGTTRAVAADSGVVAGAAVTDSVVSFDLAAGCSTAAAGGEPCSGACATVAGRLNSFASGCVPSKGPNAR